MDGLTASMSGQELTVILAWIVFASVLGVQKLKALVALRKPRVAATSWVWFAASVVVPAALVAIVCQRWAQSIINPMLPEALRLSIDPSATLPTAFTAIMGANGAYPVLKKLGLVKRYDQVPTEPEAPEETRFSTAEAVPTPSKATLFLKLCHPADSTFVLIEDDQGQHVYPVTPD